MTRHKIHLPEYNFTVIMLKGRSAVSIPDDWQPEAGDKIRVRFSETAGRFMRKTFYDSLELLEKGPAAINDFSESGTALLLDPGSLTVRLPNGRMKEFLTGAETVIYPKEAEINSGDSVQINYYQKLIGDRTLRATATVARKIE